MHERRGGPDGMNVTHRRRPHRRAAAWRTLSVVAALGAVTTLTAVPGPGVAEGPPGIEGVVLSGPTGTRSGVEIDDPAAPPDVAMIAPFDTYGREPALTIADMDGGSWSFWEVTAVPATDPGADPIPLATGVAEVPLD